VRRTDNLTTFMCQMSWNLDADLLKASRPVQACNGTALPFLPLTLRYTVWFLLHRFSTHKASSSGRSSGVPNGHKEQLCIKAQLPDNSWGLFDGKKVKVKCTLVQALRLCTARTAHRGSTGIALLFLDHGTRRGWGVSVTPRAALYLMERPWYP